MVDSTPTGNSQVDAAASLQAVALSIIGFYFFASSLFDAVFWVARIKLYSAVMESSEAFVGAPAVMPDDFAGMVATGVQALAGVLLLLGGKGVGRLLVKARGHA